MVLLKKHNAQQSVVERVKNSIASHVGPLGGADLRFIALSQDAGLHFKTIDTF